MKFFNNHEVFYPWQKELRTNGFRYLFRPREVFWLKNIRKLNPQESQKILEVGCGRGVTLDRLKKEFGLNTFGIDIAGSAIADAKKECAFKHDLRIGSATEIPFDKAFFDLVVTFDVLEHIENQKLAISEMVRVLKPGGKILIYTINTNQIGTWNWILNKLGIDIYKRSDHNSKLFLNAKILEKQLNDNQIQVSKVVFYDAFWTLAVNEIITLCFMWEKPWSFARMELFFATLFSVFVGPVLWFLDLPWTLFNKSNSIMLTGIKK